MNRKDIDDILIETGRKAAKDYEILMIQLISWDWIMEM
jgi:hypothetical protein